MTRGLAQSPSRKSLTLLSRLLLPPMNGKMSSSPGAADLKRELLDLSKEEFDDVLALAQSNHVVVRGLEVVRNLMREERDAARAEWAESALKAERARIETALMFLYEICSAFEKRQHAVTVIKTLDHWPDFGSDMDLYTNANPKDVLEVMQSRFGAELAPRSWGDRLANKWNFLLSGLPEAVEIHVGRIGQTGEQVAVASSLIKRTRPAVIDGYVFRVSSASDRVMISTLQRMYRHFYFRLCDIADTVTLVEANGVDYEDLRSSASTAGIWEGVATYLAIVSDYARQYRGTGLRLPQFVRTSARFGGDRVYFERGFLRLPIMPQSARLYGSQLAGVLARGELSSGARLSLLPWLATAAVVGQKLTGSDKGIW